MLRSVWSFSSVSRKLCLRVVDVFLAYENIKQNAYNTIELLNALSRAVQIIMLPLSSVPVAVAVAMSKRKQNTGMIGSFFPDVLCKKRSV